MLTGNLYASPSCFYCSLLLHKAVLLVLMSFPLTFFGSNKNGPVPWIASKFQEPWTGPVQDPGFFWSNGLLCGGTMQVKLATLDWRRDDAVVCHTRHLKKEAYGDTFKNPTHSELIMGDVVLLCQRKTGKLVAPFHLKVTDVKGAMIMVQRNGHAVIRNRSHFKRETALKFWQLHRAILPLAGTMTTMTEDLCKDSNPIKICQRSHPKMQDIILRGWAEACLVVLRTKH